MVERANVYFFYKGSGYIRWNNKAQLVIFFHLSLCYLPSYTHESSKQALLFYWNVQIKLTRLHIRQSVSLLKLYMHSWLHIDIKCQIVDFFLIFAILCQDLMCSNSNSFFIRLRLQVNRKFYPVLMHRKQKKSRERKSQKRIMPYWHRYMIILLFFISTSCKKLISIEHNYKHMRGTQIAKPVGFRVAAEHTFSL